MARLASDWRRCPFRAFVLVLILLLQSIVPTFAAIAGNGNPTTYRGRTNTYDLPGRMATMRDGNNWSVGYTYGADGLIASRAKTIYVWMFGAWTPVTSTPTYFIHDGGEPVFELAQDLSEDPASTYSVSNITVRGPDGLVARKQGSSWIYYEFDQQGNVSQRRNSSGGLLTSSIYDAYGAETNNGGTPTDPFGYNAQWGYWLDRDTGLYLCQHRWYDPVTARWVNRDPIGYSGGANLYGYCKGRPVDSWDASGHQGAVEGEEGNEQEESNDGEGFDDPAAFGDPIFGGFLDVLRDCGRGLRDWFDARWPSEPEELPEEWEELGGEPDGPNSVGRNNRRWRTPDGSLVEHEQHPPQESKGGWFEWMEDVPQHILPHYHVTPPGGERLGGFPPTLPGEDAPAGTPIHLPAKGRDVIE